jgi:hypothetical protein
MEREVMHMKTLTTIITVMALSLAIGVAYADEFPIMAGKDVGTELYLNAFAAPDTAISKDFSVIGEREVPMEIGAALYHDAFSVRDSASDAKGSAAGGVANVDENTRIWDTLLSPAGGSDLP